MKNIFVLILLLSSNQFFSQKIKIQLTDKDNIPVENAQIFSDSTIIDKTNSKGFFSVNTKKYDKIIIVKEDYYDTIISLEKMTNKIQIRKIKAILLEEVIVTNFKVENILDSVYKNIKTLKNISFTSNLHFYNIFKNEQDTLTFINKRLLYKGKDGYYCENEKNIINNFKLTPDRRPIYSLRNNEIYFNFSYLHSNEPYLSTELLFIIKNKKEFNYSLSKSDGLYKIEFEHKKSNKEFPYNGYLIVDIEDFGIYEFNCLSSIDKKNKRNVVIKDNIINFKILNEESFIKYNKNESGKYELVTYRFDSQLQVLDGYFKNSIFTNKCRKEPTLSFDFSKIKKIDLATYKIIK